MPKVIQILSDEHRLFEALLDAMTNWAKAHAPKDDPETLERFVLILSELADQFHHGIEEDILFMALLDSPPHQPGYSVSYALNEHDETRRLIKGLNPNPPLKKEEFHDHLARLSRLMKDHIHNEEKYLYRRALSLSPEEKKRINALCHARFHTPKLEARREQLVAWAKDIISRFK